MPVPQPIRNSWKKLWNVMEAVRWRFKISATTFHITSLRPMPLQSLSHLGINTNDCHMFYPTRRPSPKSTCTRSTTFSQFEIYIGVFTLFSSVPSTHVPTGTVVVLSATDFNLPPPTIYPSSLPPPATP